MVRCDNFLRSLGTKLKGVSENLFLSNMGEKVFQDVIRRDKMWQDVITFYGD